MTRWRLVVLGLIGLPGSSAVAQRIACTFDDLLARYDLRGGSIVLDVAVHDTRACLVRGREFHVVDVTDAAAPALLGLHEGDADLHRVAMTEGIACCAASDDGLLIYDISDPTAPLLASQVKVYSYATDVQIVDNVAYACWSVRGLRAFDVTDPANPRQLGGFDPQWGYHTDVAVVDGLALLVSFEDMWIVDVSDPANMTELARVQMSTELSGVCASGDYAFLAQTSDGLVVLDISDPTSPIQVAQLALPAEAYSIDVEAGTAYVGMGGRGCAVVDVSQPDAPVLLALYDPQGDLNELEIREGTGYFATSIGLEIFDVRTPPPPWDMAWVDVPPDARAIALRGDYAFVGSYDGGISVIDVGDAAGPRLAGSYVSSNRYAHTVAIDIVDDVAYVAIGQGGMEILDISDPVVPELLGSTGAYVTDVTVQAGIAYQAVAGTTMRIYDVAEPSDPVLLSSAPAWALCIDVNGSFAYCGEYGLDVFDVSDPASPQLIATDVSGTDVYDVLSHGNYVFAADRIRGILVYDVTDPALPALVASDFALPFQMGLHAVGDALYAAGWLGVSIFSIANPAQPLFIGSVSPGELLGDVVVRDGYAYFLERDRYQQVNKCFVIDVSPCHGCAADRDNDGDADTHDVIVFLNSWAAERAQDCSAGDCASDLDGNGVVDTRDFVAFLRSWAAGCP